MGVLKRLTTGMVLCVGLAGAPLLAPAQDRAETLADIRQELTVLSVEIQRLKGELNTTRSAAGAGVSGSLLDRVDAIEAALTQLTARTEELEHRIDRVVADGTNQIGDLAFRLCELESDCDVASLGETPVLGGGTLPAANAPLTPAEPPAAPQGNGEQLAVAEQSDFDAAVAALEAGRAKEAADRFATFLEDYPGGPMTGRANYLRGEALAEQGLTAEAARAYLASFSASPEGETAPDALLKLGVALGDLGQVNEACVTLGEVGKRFPAAAAVAEAEQARAKLGCP